jgi:hypothetical protein
MITSHPVDIPRALAEWINGHLPGEALWEVRPVDSCRPPYTTIAYDVIVTGDRPPQAARSPRLDTACRRAVLRYLRQRAPDAPRKEKPDAARHRP